MSFKLLSIKHYWWSHSKMPYLTEPHVSHLKLVLVQKPLQGAVKLVNGPTQWSLQAGTTNMWYKQMPSQASKLEYGNLPPSVWTRLSSRLEQWWCRDWQCSLARTPPRTSCVESSCTLLACEKKAKEVEGEETKHERNQHIKTANTIDREIFTVTKFSPVA